MNPAPVVPLSLPLFEMTLFGLFLLKMLFWRRTVDDALLIFSSLSSTSCEAFNEGGCSFIKFFLVVLVTFEFFLAGQYPGVLFTLSYRPTLKRFLPLLGLIYY